MAHGASYTVRYRRRREKKTNYKRRFNFLKAGKPRFVVRSSNAHMLAQLVEYTQDGDKVIVQAHSNQLKEMGWSHALGSIPSAYLTGVLCGKRAVDKKVSEAIPDLGMASLVKGGRLYAAIKGAIDGGLAVSADESAFPKKERLTGEHISGRVARSKGIVKDVESLKTKILEGK